MAEEEDPRHIVTHMSSYFIIFIEQSGVTFLPRNTPEAPTPREAEVSKLVMRMERHYDQDERETDGVVHWKSMGPKLRKAFKKVRGRKLSDLDWLRYFFEGSNKTRYQYCKMSKKMSHCTFVRFKDTMGI